MILCFQCQHKNDTGAPNHECVLTITGARSPSARLRKNLRDVPTTIGICLCHSCTCTHQALKHSNRKRSGTESRSKRNTNSTKTLLLRITAGANKVWLLQDEPNIQRLTGENRLELLHLVSECLVRPATTKPCWYLLVLPVVKFWYYLCCVLTLSLCKTFFCCCACKLDAYMCNCLCHIIACQ